MIPPISHQTNTQYPDRSASVIKVADYSSSLKSMQCPPIFSCFFNLFTTFVNCLKWIFCCGCYKSSTSPMDATLEIHPKILSSRDPFRNQIFRFDRNGGYTFREKEGFKEISDLFEILGTNHYCRWVPKMFTLNEKERKIKGFNIHPLEFLYFIFCNHLQTSRIVNFHQQSINGAWFLKLRTGIAPWEKFLNQNANNFVKKQTEISKMIPGFCKALGLNEKNVQALAHKKQWKELITHVFEERKKHFNL